ncbi:hypothetical protein L9F63_015666, partial [Diploptera punctata]
NCALMKAFLRLSYNWGEMRILLLHYSVKSESMPLQHEEASLQDLSATNLTYLHPYLSSESWNLIAQSINSFAEDDVKELLVKMIVQKLRVITLFLEEGKLKKDVTERIARHIASHIRECRTFILSETNCSLISPFLNSEQLESIADYFIQNITNDADPSVCAIENREFVVALTCAALSGIMKLFSRTKRKHDSPNHKAGPPLIRKMLSKMDSGFILKCFLDNDLEALSPVISEIAVLVNEAFQKEKDPVNGHKIDTSMGTLEYLHLLKSLPLQYAPSMIKLFVVISMAALAITLEQLDAWKENSQSSKIRELLYKDLVLGLLDCSNPPSISAHLDIGQMAHWFTKVDTQLSRELYSLLFQRLFESSIAISSSFQQLHSGLPMLQKHASAESQSVQETEAAIALLHVLNKCADVHENSEDHRLCEKYQHRLSHTVVKTLQHVQEGNISPITCEVFNLTLVHCLKQNDQKNLNKLTSHLKVIIQSVLVEIQKTESSSYKNYIDVLTTTLRNKQQLNEFLPVDLILRVWSAVNNHQFGNPELWKLLFETASEKEFQVILKDLQTSTKTALKSSEEFESLKTRMLIWKSIVLSKFNDDKINRRKVALEQLFQGLSGYTTGLECNHFQSPDDTILPLLEFLITVAQNTLLYFSAEMLDVCFNSFHPMDIYKPEHCFASYSAWLRLLQTLMKQRQTLVLDRIPSFVNCYREIVKSTAIIGRMEKGYTPAQVQQCASCAQRLERLTNCFKDHKAHFARVAPYLIADLLQMFETYTFYPQVKV